MAGGQMMQPASSKERAVLLDWLNGQRSHVLGVMRGLPEEGPPAPGTAVGVDVPGDAAAPGRR